MMKFDTREQWLKEAATKLQPLFEEHGYKVPANIRYSCGWPSKSALSAKHRRIGECWSKDASSDEQFEIFISPALGEPLRALDVLVHEIVHAVVGLKEGHNATFKRCAVAVGLEGKMTATTASEQLIKRLKGVHEELGAYPHGALVGMTNGRKKEGTRLIKCTCPECGYNVRTTAKWLEVGAPICPACDEAMAPEVKEE